jgi:N-acetylneuraminic acid mutarotase
MLSGIVSLMLLPLAVTQHSGEWNSVAQMPTPRSEIAAAVLDDLIYVGGGLAPAIVGWEALAVFEVYDPATDSWHEAAPLPVGLHHLAMAAAGGKIYVTGGYDGANFDADVSATWAYDPTTDSWTRVADMPAPRAAHAMVNIDDMLYVVGGVGPEPTALWVYDPVTDTWDASRAPMPTAREHLAATTVDGQLYVIGGRWSGRGNLSTLEVYDPATDSWAQLADMPTPRGGLTAATLAGRIHVTGGEALDSLRTFGEHEVYDPTTDTWITLPDLPTPRHGLTSVVLNGQWYVIGGGTEAGFRTFVSLSDLVEVFKPLGSEGDQTTASSQQ